MRQLKYLDTRRILNRNHPLNRGLVSEWVVLPGLAGGRLLYDIMGKNDGVLTNGPTWQSTVRPGGFGSLGFDGSDDYVNLGRPASLDMTGSAMAVACFCRPTSSGQTAGLICKDNGTADTQYTLIMLNGTFQFRVSADSNAATVGTTTLPVNDWSFVGGDYDGTTLRTYLNGKPEGVTAPMTGNIISRAVDLEIGNRNGNSLPFLGQIDCVMIWNRSLSASQWRMLFEEVKSCNPNRWNWLSYDQLSGSQILIPNNHAWRTADGNYYILQQLLAQ